MPDARHTAGSRGRHVLWRLVDGVGLEHCRYVLSPDGPTFSGTVVTAVDGEPATIEYWVRCDRFWHTREASVAVARAGSEQPVTSLHLTSDGDGNWWRTIEGGDEPRWEPIPGVAGAIDVDLAFTPATNTLPIRRHELVIGAKTNVTAAWVQFPSLEVAPLAQQYHRVGPSRYRYESYAHGFVAMLDVDDLGLVRSYEGIWERLAEADVTGEAPDDSAGEGTPGERNDA